MRAKPPERIRHRPVKESSGRPSPSSAWKNPRLSQVSVSTQHHPTVAKSADLLVRTFTIYARANLGSAHPTNPDPTINHVEFRFHFSSKNRQMAAIARVPTPWIDSRPSVSETTRINATTAAFIASSAPRNRPLERKR